MCQALRVKAHTAELMLTIACRVVQVVVQVNPAVASSSNKQDASAIVFVPLNGVKQGLPQSTTDAAVAATAVAAAAQTHFQ
jgi:hypothetical protein